MVVRFAATATLSQLNDNLQPMKMFSLNAISWVSTVATLQMAADVLQVLVMTGSIIVSSLSAWWIIKQAKNLDRINREAEQNRLKDAE